MIKSIKAREISDSRGIPTIEVELETNSGVFKASVPSGTSKGKYEAVELRDEDGKGVSKALKNIEEIIAPELKGKNPQNQKEIDELMIALDGTENKSKLGANSISAVSIAVCRAGAAENNLPLYKHLTELTGIRPLSTLAVLPTPSLLLIEGGLHSETEKKLSIQEFMITAGGDSFKEKFKKATEVYNYLGQILKREIGETADSIGYEGGFAPPLEKTEEALDLIIKAIEKAGYQNEIKITLDVAASSFYYSEMYKFEGENFNSEELLNFYSDILEKYPIIFLEDPFAEEDWKAWKEFDLKLEADNLKLILVGDDLTVTNKERVERAIQENCINGIIVKPNQVGTVTETLECVKIAKQAGLKIIVSHRSGDTLDDFIADLSVGIGADFIKTGGPFKPERIAKYNRLLKIEEELS